MLPILVHLHVLALTWLDRRRRPAAGEGGQTTAEYALVLLGAAAVAVLIGLWAKQGGKVGALLDAIFNTLVRQVKS